MVLYSGDVLNQPNFALVLAPGHREDLKRIEKETGCLLENNYRQEEIFLAFYKSVCHYAKCCFCLCRESVVWSRLKRGNSTPLMAYFTVGYRYL